MIRQFIGRIIGRSYTILIKDKRNNRIIDMYDMRAFNKADVLSIFAKHLIKNPMKKNVVYEVIVMNNKELLAFADQKEVRELLENI